MTTDHLFEWLIHNGSVKLPSHPPMINLPPNLREKLNSEWQKMPLDSRPLFSDFLITHSFHLGYDQGVEAGASWIRDQGYHPSVLKDFLAALSRPTTVSERATRVLDDAMARGDNMATSPAIEVLREALARLAELEKEV